MMDKFHYRPRFNKYLIYNNNESGLGDRILGVISTFLYATLNYYHFRIKDFEPIPLQNIFYSKYPWSDKLWMRQNLKRGVLNFHSDVNGKKDLFSEGVIQDIYPNTDALMFNCNQNFAHMLFDNPSYTDRIEELNYDRRTIYRELFDYLFTLRSEHQENYDYLKENILNKNGRTIGVHIRTNHFWGDVPFMDDYTYENFIQAIEKILKENDKIFVCTDNPEYIVKLKNRFPDRVVNSLKGRVVHNTKSKDQNLEDLLKTFYEIKLLAECDVRVLSYWSNFSRVSGLLAGDNNYIVDFSVDCGANWQTKNWCQLENIEGFEDVLNSYNIQKPINGFRECEWDELMIK